MYTLDNNKHYKYYELQKVDDVETSGRKSNLPTREDIMKKNTINRKRKQEGIFKNINVNSIFNHLYYHK